MSKTALQKKNTLIDSRCALLARLSNEPRSLATIMHIATATRDLFRALPDLEMMPVGGGDHINKIIMYARKMQAEMNADAA